MSRAQFVITMLPTGEIILTVVEPLLEEWPDEAIWLQMSSVGVAEADRLVQIAADHGITLSDAPVSGSTHPAEEGKLTILASGPDSARPQVEPVFEALGSRVQWAGRRAQRQLRLLTRAEARPGPDRRRLPCLR